MRHLRSLFLAAPLALIASCGEHSSAPFEQIPSPAGNRSSNEITYRLIPAQGPFDPSGSQIRLLNVGLGIPPPPPTPIDGTFEVAPVVPAPANSGFAVNITRLAFTGDGYVVAGEQGYIETTTEDVRYPLKLTATVRINGETTELRGVGDPQTFSMDSPPSFRGVNLFSDPDSGGFYYHLRLFAAPSE